MLSLEPVGLPAQGGYMQGDWEAGGAPSQKAWRWLGEGSRVSRPQSVLVSVTRTGPQ